MIIDFTDEFGSQLLGMSSDFVFEANPVPQPLPEQVVITGDSQANVELITGTIDRPGE